MGLIRRRRNRRLNLLLIVAILVAGYYYLQSTGELPGLLDTVSKSSLSFSRGSGHNNAEDLFASFEGREQCGFGANDLHAQFPGVPLCSDRETLLDAISFGGRTGFDGPYIPRGCDMKWYGTEEICHILGRYEGIVVIGDSLARHLVTALSIILRKNLLNGGQMSWMERTKEHGCQCDAQYQLFFCHATDIRNMSEVYNNDPASFGCPFLERPTVNFGEMPKYPLELFGDYPDQFIEQTLHPQRTQRPYAFIFSQGLWNDCNFTATTAWLDQITARIAAKRPYLAQHAPVTRSPRIYVSPSAPGESKQNEFLEGQGHQAVSRFEKFMRIAVKRYPGMDFLGTYNMSLQGAVPDGTHAGIRTNLIKAMALINWLDWSDTKEWQRQAPYWAELEKQDDMSRKLAWEQAVQDLSAEEQARFKKEYKKVEGIEQSQQQGQHEPAEVVTSPASPQPTEEPDPAAVVADVQPALHNGPGGSGSDTNPPAENAPQDQTTPGNNPQDDAATVEVVDANAGAAPDPRPAEPNPAAAENALPAGGPVPN